MTNEEYRRQIIDLADALRAEASSVDCDGGTIAELAYRLYVAVEGDGGAGRRQEEAR